APRRLHRLAVDRADSNFRSRVERLARERVRTARPEPGSISSHRYLECHDRPDRADPALCTVGADPDRSSDGPFGDARNMTKVSSSATLPIERPGPDLRFYGIWLAGAI